MMRNATLFLVTASLMTVPGAVLDANAQPRVEIEWATSGAGPVANPDVAAVVGDTLTATFYLENVGGTVAGYAIDLTFDAAELSLQSSTEFLPTGFDFNLGAGTGNFGFSCGLTMYEAVVNWSPPVGGRFAVGQAVFDVIAVNADGQPDVVTSPCASAGGVFNGTPADVTGSTTFQSGRVFAAVVPSLEGRGIVVLAGLLLGATIWITRRQRAETG